MPPPLPPLPPPLPVALVALPVVDPAVADDADLTCPLCGYDLRGLPERRCPECGHAFDPDELRRARAERRDWFFEHARRRLARSFVVTSFISLNPILFWQRVQAAHQIEPRRLTLWWATWIALAIAALLTLFGHAAYVERAGSAGFSFVSGSPPVRFFRASNGRMIPTTTRPPPTRVAPTIDWPTAIDRAIARRAFLPSAKVVIAAIAWPSVAALAMSVFAQTLRKAGVSRGHVRRCTHYALPLTLLPVFAIVLASAAFGWESQRVAALADFWYLRVFHLSDVASIALVAAIAGSTLHLVTSHVCYLRLPQAALTALLAQTVAWLAIAVVIFFVGTIV